MQPVVNLEVTVPRIIFSANKGRSRQLETLAEETGGTSPPVFRGVEGRQDEELEQVRILPLGAQRDAPMPQRNEQQHDIVGEASPSTAQEERFRTFRVKDVAAQGHALVLQILRRWTAGSQQRQSKATDDREQTWLSDEVAFTLEFRHTEVSQAEPGGQQPRDAATVTPPGDQATLHPGVNQVLIFLDQEGIPNSYRINGAEG